MNRKPLWTNSTIFVNVRHPIGQVREVRYPNEPSRRFLPLRKYRPTKNSNTQKCPSRMRSTNQETRMSSPSRGIPNLEFLHRIRDLILPIGLVACVFVILVPLPAFLIDILLAANIALAILLVLSAVHVERPLELSVFPSVLLTTTLMRLVLNVATTRLILTRAETDGPLAAGRVVSAFSQFVAGDKIVVGVILFLIIVVIQFVVITKGSTRISEVAARFALDGMPGRQMAIDADLNTGVIDQKEAQRRRSEIIEQADFYGAMDGAGKFVRGDAIAGLIIISVNIVGGLYIGLFEAGMPLGEAASLFTRLTIGDGLTAQIPAFLIALAAGLLITRSSQSTRLPRQYAEQLFARPEVLGIAGAFILSLLITGLPKIPLLAIGGACCLGAYMLRQRKLETEEENRKREKTRSEAEASKKPAEHLLRIDPLEISLGVGLVSLADSQQGGDLLARIQEIREDVASDIGILLPKVRVRDSDAIDRFRYRILLEGQVIGEGVLDPEKLLAVRFGKHIADLEGTPTRDPAFGTPALWIDAALREEAEATGCVVAEPVGVLATHLAETVRKHAFELLTRDATKQLIDQLRENSPAAVDELIPDVMRLSEVQQVLQMLLREQVPIRRLGLILQVLGDYAPKWNEPALLVEYVRAALARTICSRYRTQSGELRVVTLDPEMEDAILSSGDVNAANEGLRLPPDVQDKMRDMINVALRRLTASGSAAVLLASPPVRPLLRELTQNIKTDAIVLSYNEITQDTRLDVVEMIEAPDALLQNNETQAAALQSFSDEQHEWNRPWDSAEFRPPEAESYQWS
jgi:flagellar biosynthesis protein FlhA